MQLDHFGMYPERAFMKVAGRMTLEGGGGKGSSPPPAPDYTGAAQATAAGNKEAAIAAQEGNMINQYTPQGSVVYTQRGTSGSGTPLWSQTVSLSPEQQAAYNKDVAMNARLQDVGMQGVGYVQNALNAPLQSPGQAVGTAGTTNFVTGVNAPTLRTEVGPTQQIQGNINQPNINLQTGGQAGQIQSSMESPELTQQRVTDALYQQQTQYLDPQFQRSQARLENQLANQGITRGSEAWNNAMQEQGQQRQQAYESARNAAIGQGVAAGSQMFQNQLAGGQFANTAQQQAYQQSLSNAQMQNQARAQQLQEALSTGQFANQAQAQAYAQELQNLQAQNAALSQQFSFGQQNANLANQAANQQYAQQLSNAQLANQAMQQNFANAQTLQQQPINILNAVRSGAQMQASQQPQVGVSSPGQLATWSGPDLLGAATAQGQYNQGLYNAQTAASSAQTSGLMGLAGTGMMAGAMMSDRRVKENIIKIGVLDNGLNLYSFEYKPEWKDEAGHGKFVGVMADEAETIMPEAVIIRPDGFKMVNYEVIYG
jgi:hypothetical protein